MVMPRVNFNLCISLYVLAQLSLTDHISSCCRVYGRMKQGLPFEFHDWVETGTFQRLLSHIVFSSLRFSLKMSLFCSYCTVMPTNPKSSLISRNEHLTQMWRVFKTGTVGAAQQSWFSSSVTEGIFFLKK